MLLVCFAEWGVLNKEIMGTLRKGTLTIVCEISSEGYDKIMDNQTLLNAIATGIQTHFDEKEYTGDDKTIVNQVESKFLSYAQVWCKR